MKERRKREKKMRRGRKKRKKPEKKKKKKKTTTTKEEGEVSRCSCVALVARRKRYPDGVTGEITTSGSRSTSAGRDIRPRLWHGNFAGPCLCADEIAHGRNYKVA
ncbi:hypothetical protein DBV15_05142 [Temnothorax longispinosus]|uniref:Uncharacterized protein n=1 Tax=Temnothorax longispinosus TaxID=300112 RepID=A0A4S2KUM1_9HYME|nr:hypothetical protein DBV15_05142 [Temnothorax longispinosus]